MMAFKVPDRLPYTVNGSFRLTPLLNSLISIWNLKNANSKRIVDHWVFNCPIAKISKHWRTVIPEFFNVCQSLGRYPNSFETREVAKTVHWYVSAPGSVLFALPSHKKTHQILCVISGFCREADENRTLLGYYAASSGNFLPTFRDSLSFPSWSLQIGPIGSTETSVRNYHHSLLSNLEECSSHVTQ